MFCENCGAKIEPGMLFCGSCGVKLPEVPEAPIAAPVAQQEAPAASVPYDRQTTPVTQPEAPAAYAPYVRQTTPVTQPEAPAAYAPYGRQTAAPVSEARSRGGVIDTVKRHLGSPVLLVAAILLSISFLISLIGAFTQNTVDLSAMSLLLSEAGMSSSAMSSGMSAFWSTMIISTIISSIPTILILIGLWLAYAAGKSRSDTVSTAGLTIVKGVCVFQLVMVCILFALCLVALFGGFALGSSLMSYLPSEARRVGGTIAPIMFVIAAVVIAVFVMAIIYYTQIFKTINTVRTTIRTKKASANVSGFVAVINFILAFFSFVAMVLSLTATGIIPQIGVVGGVNAFSIINGICSTTVLILFGVLIFMYRSDMQKLGNAHN